MEFLYSLRLIDRLILQNNWTKEDEQIVDRHLQYLKSLKEEGTLILAGKTSGLDKETKGLVIFNTNSHEDAKKIMGMDPAIKEGIMTGKLQQYDVALFNHKYKK